MEDDRMLLLASPMGGGLSPADEALQRELFGLCCSGPMLILTFIVGYIGWRILRK